MLAINGCIVAMICFIFMDPTLAIRLFDMGVSSTMIGMAFSFMGAFLLLEAQFLDGFVISLKEKLQCSQAYGF